MLIFGLLSPQIYADVQRFSNFQYDEAGNIVRISHIDQFNLPDVTNLDSGFVNRGRTVRITVIGTDLFAAQVTTTAPGLIISNVSTTQTGVTFDISAEQTATLGPVIITFTTGVGSTSQSFSVAESLPGLVIHPNPIIIADNTQPSTIQLSFTEPRPTQEIYTLTTADPLTATTSVSSITMAAGATIAQFELSGIALGSTTLNVALPEKLFFFSFPVFVSENFVGDSEIFSRPLAVSLLDNNQGIGNPLLSQSVGVFLPANDQSIGNPLLSPDVGVFTGPTITSYLPTVLQPGSQVDILLTGSDLDEVTGISIEPAGIITVDNFLSAPDGTQLTVTLSVDPTAATGDYQMIIASASGEVTLRQGVRVTLSIP